MIIKNAQIRHGIQRLKSKLKQLDVDALPIHDYNKYYLHKHLEHLSYNLYINGLVLEKAWCANPDIEVICDYGAGTGLLGLLAQESFGCRVIFVDTYAAACQDLPKIATALELKCFKIVQGDVAALKKAYKVDIDALVSRDVIEHIYDLKSFFRTCHQINEDMVQVHNTAANVYNILRKSEFKKIHHKMEYIGDENKLKETDTKAAYYQQRLDIIQEIFPYIGVTTATQLAEETKGLAKKDIENAVDAYLQGKTSIKKDQYKHNTCDPNTGNWAERLLYFNEYADMASPYFVCSFSGLNYNQKTAKKQRLFLVKLINFVIDNSNLQGRFLWPSFNLTLKPNSD